MGRDAGQMERCSAITSLTMSSCGGATKPQIIISRGRSEEVEQGPFRHVAHPDDAVQPDEERDQRGQHKRLLTHKHNVSITASSTFFLVVGGGDVLTLIFLTNVMNLLLEGETTTRDDGNILYSSFCHEPLAIYHHCRWFSGRSDDGTCAGCPGRSLGA